MTLWTRARSTAVVGLGVVALLGVAGCGSDASGGGQYPGPAQVAVPAQLIGTWSGGESQLFGSTYLHFWPDGGYLWDFDKVPDISGQARLTGSRLTFYVNGSPSSVSSVAFGAGLLYLDGKSYVYAGPP
ncbi:MAG TPA: hypothetical protein VLJ59_09610 [Mycobacteriales bacterium]|nr:hypothetical protein [Mycobacteriales bacterium]